MRDTAAPGRIGNESRRIQPLLAEHGDRRLCQHLQHLWSTPILVTRKIRRGQRSSAFGRVWIVGLLSIGAAAALGSAAMWGGVSSPEPGVQRATYAITRGNLIVSVTEEGTLESSKNTEVKCQIRGGYGGRGGQSTVTWVIPSGSIVKAGDELVRLDTKIIEETISLGKTDTNIAKAELARAQADLANAEIAIDAYLNGRYRTQMKQLEKQRKVRQVEPADGTGAA